MTTLVPGWLREVNAVAKTSFVLGTFAMVAIWCWKIGWVTGIIYLLFFDQIKRLTALRVSSTFRLKSGEDAQKMRHRMVAWLVVVHIVQLALLVILA